MALNINDIAICIIHTQSIVIFKFLAVYLVLFALKQDEVEALSSIYGDEWCVVDEEHRIYCIQVDDGQDPPQWTVNIQVCTECSSSPP